MPSRRSSGRAPPETCPTSAPRTPSRAPARSAAPPPEPRSIRPPPGRAIQLRPRERRAGQRGRRLRAETVEQQPQVAPPELGRNSGGRLDHAAAGPEHERHILGREISAQRALLL